MLYVLSFLGLVFVFLFVRGLFAGTRRKKEAIDAACADYMGFKRDIKAWFSDRESKELRRKADSAMQAINHCIKVKEFTRPADVKTAKQAVLYTYAKEIASLYNIDVEQDFASPIDIGDPAFRDAVHAYYEQTSNDASGRVSSPGTTVDRVESHQLPSVCPKCGHSPVAEILYGFPDFEDEGLKKAVDEGRVAFGGSVIGGDQPTWKCTRCGLDIFRSGAPA